MRDQEYYERGYDDAPRRARSQNGKKRKKKRSGSRGERVVVTLLSLLFLTVAAVATVKYVVRAPEPDADDPDQQTEQDGTQDEDIDAIETIANGKERKKYCYTILVYGVDNDAGGSDTNMLMRFDAEGKKIDVVSLPRDTLMSNGHKLNSSYNNGGTEKLRSNIEDMLGIPVDFYVSVDLKGFIALIDQIGGVDFDVPEDMDYDDPYQDLHIHQTKGYRKLSGSDVMQVLRYRHDTDIHYGYPDGDLGRIKTQQSLLKAMIEQLLQLKNVTKIGDFARAVKNNVTSDLTFEEMLWFGSQAVMGGLKVEDVNFVTMPNTALYVYSRAYPRWPQNYVFPKAQELLDIVNNELSPFVEKFTMSDLDIMSLNSDGSLSSSTGHVEDSKAAVAPPVVVDRYSGDILGGTSSNSGTETSTGNGSETADGSETTDPGTTDPGNSGTVDPGTTDPGNSGTVDPGTTDPGNSGTTDPGTGEGGNTGDTGSSDTVVDEMPEWLRP